MTYIDSPLDTLIENILNGLNTKQREAVTAPSNGRLQIIAGPGTGKTKVLISRVAYLLLNNKISPQHIIVTTFTKKAANEMVERLVDLLKDSNIDVSKILIGTFHSICYRIIKIYGKKIDIADYSITDERDSNQVLQEVLSKLSPAELEYISGLPQSEADLFKSGTADDGKYHGYDPKKFKRQISKLKSSGIQPANYSRLRSCNRLLMVVYKKYQDQLKNNLLLDFDDCLLFCYTLITKYPVLNFVEHVLVDEFQDTNEIQLQLMYEFAKGHPTKPKLQNNVTIVGDPDQSIYAFRDAQFINFEKMKNFYKRNGLEPCDVITLNENYRSTSDILNLSEKIMRQQEKRLMKTLKSQINTSFRPVYFNLASSEEEARWIVYQIENLMALPNSIFKYSDISILVRSAYQTRVIEDELFKRRIPYVMIRGKAFWDRKEVSAILDYLRIIANENDRIAYLRTINFPRRSIGIKTLSAIDVVLEAEIAKQCPTKDSIFETLWKIANFDVAEVKLTSKNRESLINYLNFIKESRELLKKVDDYHSTSILSSDKKTSLITNFFEFVYTRSGIQKEFHNDPNCELNIFEVQKQLCEFTPMDEELPLYIGGRESEIDKDERNYLAKFIHSIGLYETDSSTEMEKEEQIAAKYPGMKYSGKVALSTIHGSKGLEWPVVFVPGLSEGLLPAKFALDSGGKDAVDEERRCFYVAITRAKTLLYLSSYIEENRNCRWGRRPIESASRFMLNMGHGNIFVESQHAFKNWNLFNKLYEVRDKQKPSASHFNLDHFNRLYQLRLKAFLKGSDFRITGENFASSNQSLSSDIASTDFSTARSEMKNSNEYVKIKIEERSVKKSKLNTQPSLLKSSVKQSNSNQVNGIYKPWCNPRREPMYNTDSCKMAPPYHRGLKIKEASNTANTPISYPKNNKAPPYIPVRKVPDFILKRRAKLNNKSSTNEKL